MVDATKFLDVDRTEFQSFVTSFISKMGFEIKSVKELADGNVYVHAKTTNPMGGEIISVVRAGPYGKDVDAKPVEELEGEMKRVGAVRGAFITTSDFSADAMDYVRGKPISLINRFQIVESLESRGEEIDESLQEFMVKAGLTERRFMGEDHIFIPGRKRDDVLSYFESKRKKSKGVFRGVSEKIEEVETRYAPVEMLKVTVSRDVHLEGESLGKTEHDDFLFVNLNNGDLYFLRKRRKTGSTDYSVESSSVLKEIMDLPEEAQEHLTTLLEHGELPYKHLEDKYIAILESKKVIKTYEQGRLFLQNATVRSAVNIVVFVTQEFFDLVRLFINDVMGTIGGDIDRKLADTEGAEAEKAVMASINMPHLVGGIYDLKKFLVIKMVSGLKFKVDKIRYHSSDIASLLKSIFSAVTVSPRGVLFLPYFVCTYRSLDVKGLRRREVLIAPKFISSEEREKAAVRKKELPTPEALKFDRLPYKIIR